MLETVWPNWHSSAIAIGRHIVAFWIRVASIVLRTHGLNARPRLLQKALAAQLSNHFASDDVRRARLPLHVSFINVIDEIKEVPFRLITQSP